jgi:hemerythrin-like domain-containing protein
MVNRPSCARDAAERCGFYRRDTMPKTTTKSNKRTPTKRGNAISLLESDHEKVRGMLSELEKSTKATRQSKLLEDIGVEVRTHAAIEEEVFYPAFKKALKTKEDKKLYFEAIEEHGVVHTVLPEIEGMKRGTDKFAAKAKVLKDLIEHHAEEEEEEMFPRARKVLSKDDLGELHDVMAAMKQDFLDNPEKLMKRVPAARLD